MPICHVATPTAPDLQTSYLHASTSLRLQRAFRALEILSTSKFARRRVPPAHHTSIPVCSPAAHVRSFRASCRVPGPQRACRAPEILCTPTPARLHRVSRASELHTSMCRSLQRVSRARLHRSLQRSIPTYYLHVPGSVSRLQSSRAPRSTLTARPKPRYLDIATPATRLLSSISSRP